MMLELDIMPAMGADHTVRVRSRLPCGGVQTAWWAFDYRLAADALLDRVIAAAEMAESIDALIAMTHPAPTVRATAACDHPSCCALPAAHVPSSRPPLRVPA